jgi:hypothetical protein
MKEYMFDSDQPLALIDMDETAWDFRKQSNDMLMAMGVIYEPIPDGKLPKLVLDLAVVLGNQHRAHEVRDELFNRQGFWETMPMKEGAKSGILAVRQAGIQVRFCSAPPKRAPNSGTGKRISIEQNFKDDGGAELASEAFIDRDKTFARGTVLLDDMREIHGLRAPNFKHVVYTRNSNITFPKTHRMNDWSQPEVDRFINITHAIHNGDPIPQ